MTHKEKFRAGWRCILFAVFSLQLSPVVLAGTEGKSQPGKNTLAHRQKKKGGKAALKATNMGEKLDLAIPEKMPNQGFLNDLMPRGDKYTRWQENSCPERKDDEDAKFSVDFFQSPTPGNEREAYVPSGEKLRQMFGEKESLIDKKKNLKPPLPQLRLNMKH